MKGIEKIRMMLALMLVSVKRRLPETRRLSSGITTLALAGIVLLAAAGSASAACPAPGDTVITASCALDRNWTVPAGQAGYIIGADGVTIDGMGLYKITGDVTNDNCKWADETTPCTVSGIYNAGYDNVVIKDLEIEGFCTGVALAGSGGNKVRNITVDNCKIHDNGFNTTSGGSGMTTQGIHACHIDGSVNVPALTIVNNEIYNTEGTGCGCGDGGNGIFIYGGSGEQDEYCNISYNELYHNAKSGFWTKMMLSRCNITHNHAWENGGGAGIGDNIQGGIVLRCKKSNYNFVAYNNVSNNGGATNYGYGIYVGGCNNTIWDNTANNNTASGICMGRSDGSDYNNVSNNTACGNKGCCCFGRADIGTCGGEGVDGCCFNYGDDNTCDICFNCDGCNDIICPYHCPETPEVDLVVTYKDETWDVEGSTYTVTYTIMNRGYATSNATNARIWIDGSVVATQAVPAIAGFGTYDGTSGPHSVDNSVSVNGATYIDNVTVCADVNNEETRDDKSNNCMSNNFGGPDLVIYPQYYVEWVDLSWKTYNLSYTVKNVGDIATTHPVWVNFTEIDDEWKDCVDPNPIPAGLQPGVTTELRTVGHFVMGGDSNWVEDWVNFNHTCPENNWDDLHQGGGGNRARFTEGYGGDCKECGDVDCSGGLPNSGDIQRLRDKAGHPTTVTLNCEWSGDVDCSGGLPAANDIQRLRDKVSHPTTVTLNCCKGCKLW